MDSATPAVPAVGMKITTDFKRMKSVRGRSVRERFEEKFARGDGCWNWLASKLPAGYGQLMVRRRPLRAHRLSWTLYRGEIPAGLYVLHRCDNPSCVNPGHLFLGTNLDNIEDMRRKGRAKVASKACPGERNGFAKLTAAQVAEIRTSRGSHAAVGRRFGINETQIGRIRMRKAWRHV